MAVYSVSFDREKLGHSYDGLVTEIRKCADWCQPFASQCMVSTSESAQQLTDRLRKALGSDDSLLIIGVANDYSGWLAKEIWFWMNKNL